MNTGTATRKSTGRARPVGKPVAGAKSGSRRVRPADVPADAATADAPLVSVELKRTPLRLSASVRAMAGAALKQPRKTVGAVARAAGELSQVLRGRSAIEPAAGDRRFDDPAWRDSIVDGGAAVNALQAEAF